MNDSMIYWPVLAQLAIPLLVLMLNGKRKGDARKAGETDPNSPIDNKAWPLPVVLTSNALANQFQLPIVFYVLCFVLAGISAVSIPAMILCWLFVVLRYFHAYVHVTTNYIPARFSSFLASSLVLLVLFGWTVFELAKAS